MEDEWRGERLVPPWRLWLGGLLLGLAAWTLNTLAVVALTITVLLLAAPAHGGRGERLGWLRERWRRLWPWALGGIIGIAGYFIYNYAVFKSLGSPYRYEYDEFFRNQMARGLMGATRPRALVAWLVTFHPFQGLLLWFPLTTLALAGLFAWLARGGRAERLEAAAALAVFGLLLLYTSAYFMWWGGWAYAPRHMIPALTLLPIGLTPWLAARRQWPGWLLLTVGTAGACVNLAAVAIDPQPKPNIAQELLLEPWRVTQWTCPMLDNLHSFRLGWLPEHSNWGLALGLPGQASLLPLLALWGVAAWLILTRLKQVRTGAGDE